MARFDRSDVIPTIVGSIVFVSLLLGLWFWLMGYSASAATAGDPESYVDTKYQCPFYENAGAKGCIVPSNLQCNADWSLCTPKDEPQPISEPVVAPVASHAVNCAESQ